MERGKSGAEWFEGIVVSGTGEGAYFLGLDWVRKEVQRVAGFDPYPGTLNLRFTEDDLPGWSRLAKEGGALLVPPERGGCGGRLIPVLVGDAVPAAVVLPDITRYGDELVEIVAPIHLRTRLGLRDGDRLRFRILAVSEERR